VGPGHQWAKEVSACAAWPLGRSWAERGSGLSEGGRKAGREKDRERVGSGPSGQK